MMEGQKVVAPELTASLPQSTLPLIPHIILNRPLRLRQPLKPKRSARLKDRPKRLS